MTARRHLFVPTDDDLASRLKEIHTASNINPEATALADPSHIFCYFARFKYRKDNKHLTAVRRANSFKGVLKSPLIRFLGESLRIVQEQTFKLDHDFDVLVDDDRVYILRPAGFEFVGHLDAEIAKAVPGNIQTSNLTCRMSISRRFRHTQSIIRVRQDIWHPFARRNLQRVLIRLT